VRGGVGKGGWKKERGGEGGEGGMKTSLPFVRAA